MPKGNGMGPAGAGPRTGRQLGPCVPAQEVYKSMGPKIIRQPGQGRGPGIQWQRRVRKARKAG